MIVPHWQYGWLQEFYFEQYQHREQCPEAVFNAIKHLCYCLLFESWAEKQLTKIDWT